MVQSLGTRALLIAGLIAIVALLVWQASSSAGAPNPDARHIGAAAAILDTGVLVFREGLECILVLSAVTASLLGSNRTLRQPIATGAGFGFLATLLTWFIAVAVLDAIQQNVPAFQIQAATGLLAIVVLLVVMNWFFHRIYWTGWISLQNRRKRDLVERKAGSSAVGRGLLSGLALLGFASVYREGFEVVLFLQNLRMQVGSAIVAEGVLIGLACTVLVGILTFVAHHRLPYKRMLVLTGVLLGAVLLVMVGEEAQEMQLAGWLSTTNLGWPIPDWIGLWFSIFPTVETLLAQALSALVVIGSYFLARYLLVWRPRRRGRQVAARPEQAPTTIPIPAHDPF